MARTFENAEVGLEEVQVLEGHSDRVWYVAWSPDGLSLASCGGDKTVRIWINHGTEQEPHWICKCILDESHQRTIRSCEWSPCSRYLATAGFDAKTAIWESADGAEFEMTTVLEGHENEVKSVAWSRSGQYLATCSRDKSVWIWERQEDDDFAFISVLYGHTQDVKMVKWHPKHDLVVSASYDDTIKVWGQKAEDSDEDWECVQTLAGPGCGHSSTVWAVSFDATGRHMVSCSDDLTVVIWDTSANPSGSGDPHSGPWKHLCTLSGYHTRTIFSVDWSGVNGMIATGAADDAVRIFSANSEASAPGQPTGFSMLAKKEKAHSVDVNCVRWHPKNPYLLASCGDDGLVKLWKLTASTDFALMNGFPTTPDVVG
eukprot:TRINITY_DN3299_c0_g1_i1.p1 TRINITY_DN3299_c0_g1~~TRINITY_DN3299_c0_g1_i1.p1  ORF type:complete len:372 (-),score=43.67 TRINITY_DN3299_c0_g1_i1:306-1421(-)